MSTRAEGAGEGQTPIQFLLEGAPVALHGVDPTRTVLQFLREDCHRIGTKEGCAEGDCGACTVVVLEPEPGGTRLRIRAVNACIQFLPTLHGKALLTVESLSAPTQPLHPVQRAMVECHASQCGFCTPGIVMSLFALYKTGRPADRGAVDQALAGNLCRCTGYRPIVEAAFRMLALGDEEAQSAAAGAWSPETHWLRTPAPAELPVDSADPAATVAADPYETDLLRRLTDLRPVNEAADGAAAVVDPSSPPIRTVSNGTGRLLAPRTPEDLAQILAEQPDACLLAGGTDVGLWVTKQHRRLDRLVYVGDVAALAHIEQHADGLTIGAAVRLSDAMPALLAHAPELDELLLRFASPPIRNAATLVGNIANGSPIGDSMPALLAMDAVLRLRAVAGTRELALDAFYLGYQQTALAQGEFIESVRIPPRPPGQRLRCYKISKRFDQDISALSAAFSAELTEAGLRQVRVAFGGMAAVPLRVKACEAVLEGAPWTETTLTAGVRALETALAPIDDLRASARYRRRVAGNLLRKFYLETSGETSDSDPTARIGVYATAPSP